MTRFRNPSRYATPTGDSMMRVGSSSSTSSTVKSGRLIVASSRVLRPVVSGSRVSTPNLVYRHDAGTEPGVVLGAGEHQCR